jgi:hypothetical protein
MRTRKSFGLTTVLLSLCSLAQAGGLSWDEVLADFGERYQFTDVEHDYQVWNRTSAAITLSTPSASIKDLSIKVDKSVVEPGTSATVHVKFAVQDRLGKSVARIPVDAEEEGKTEHYELMLRGYVESIFDESRPGIDFGVVDTKSTPVEQSVKLSSFESPDFRIARIIETPDFVSARIGADGRELFVKPTRLNRLGYNKGSIKVALESSGQREAAIAILMDIHGDVVPDQNPLGFEVQRPGMRHPVRLQLASREGKAFRIGKVQIDEAAHATAEATTCLPKARPDCTAYLVTLKKDHPFGQLSGAISFELPDTSEILTVNLGGIFISDDMKVQSLNQPAGDSGAQTQSRNSQIHDLGQALKHTMDRDSATAPAGPGPLLKWQVENEAGIYGYAIYRSEKEDGRVERVNKTLIAADNKGDNTTASHEWRDTSATSGKAYWYFIVTLYTDGRKVRLTSPQKVVAK